MLYCQRDNNMGRHDVSNHSDVTGKKTVNMNTTDCKNMQVAVGMTAKGQWDKIKAHCGVQRKTGRMSIIAKGVSGKVYGIVHIEWMDGCESYTCMYFIM